MRRLIAITALPGLGFGATPILGAATGDLLSGAVLTLTLTVTAAAVAASIPAGTHPVRRG